jgi:hypothetical protein
MKVNENEIKQLIATTVNATVLKLKAAGLLKDGSKSAFEKTEELLRQYPELKKVDDPYARKVVAEIDSCLADAESDPYVDVIRLYYFGGLTNVACAQTMCYDERTCRRNRRALVERFSVRLASEDFIRDLLL